MYSGQCAVVNDMSADFLCLFDRMYALAIIGRLILSAHSAHYTMYWDIADGKVEESTSHLVETGIDQAFSTLEAHFSNL